MFEPTFKRLPMILLTLSALLLAAAPAPAVGMGAFSSVKQRNSDRLYPSLLMLQPFSKVALVKSILRIAELCPVLLRVTAFSMSLEHV